MMHLPHSLLAGPALGMMIITAGPRATAARALSTGRANVVTYRPARGHPIRGKSTAVLKILYWADFMSLSTRRAQPLLSQLLRRYRGRVQLQYMSRYRDGSHYVPARLAAQVAREAFAQGGDRLFWKLHDRLLKLPNPTGLKKKQIWRVARASGLRMARLNRAIRSNRHLQTVSAERALSTRLGVRGYTSYVTLLVGSERFYISRYTRFSYLERVVKRNLKPARQKRLKGTSLREIHRQMLTRAQKRYKPYRRRQPRLHSRRKARWHNLPVGHSPSLGPKTATVTVVAFMDITNYSCARAWTYLRSVQKQHPKRIRLVFKALPRRRYSRSKRGARAAYAAHAQSGFWKTVDLLFRHRYRLYGSRLYRYVQQAGLNVKQFKKDLLSPAVSHRVIKDLKLARRVRATSTPTVYINGRRTGFRWNRSVFAASLKTALKGGLLTRILGR